VMFIYWESCSIHCVLENSSENACKCAEKPGQNRAFRTNCGGELGIRTLGPFRNTAFRVLHLRPLGQLSVLYFRSYLKRADMLMTLLYRLYIIGQCVFFVNRQKFKKEVYTEV
jgi:hypothetical protein